MTARFSRRLSRLGAVLALAASAVPALAQDPSARAGRVAYLAGPVSMSPAGSGGWTQAPLNRPLVAGDRLWTDAGARDEVQFGPSIARMDAGTLLGVLAADQRSTQLQLSQGRIDLHVRRVAPGETVEVDTPNLAFVVRAPGDYRIAVAPDGASSDVAVLRGAADVYGDGRAYALGPGLGYRFAGQDLENLGQVPIQPYDDFDRWAMARDARLERARSARFVPADLVGYEDLDDNGAWRIVPDYGTVWVPTRVASNWAPYHDGHWAWIDPWGWTWVDDQPWGYAVSHYGRWANLGGRWAWVPAPVRERPVYAPALVAFVGATLAFGAADGPGVGWFPLGPREPYRPSYRASPAYIERINTSNTAIPRGDLAHMLRDTDRMRYANRGVPGALVAMPAAQFAQAAPVNRAGRAMDPRMAMSAPLVAAPNARPQPQSLVGAPPTRQLPPMGVQRRVAVARSLPMALARPSGQAFAGRAPGREMASAALAPLRVLRPAPGRGAGPPPAVPPVRGSLAAGAPAPQFAGRPGMEAGVDPGPARPGRYGQPMSQRMPQPMPRPMPQPMHQPMPQAMQQPMPAPMHQPMPPALAGMGEHAPVESARPDRGRYAEAAHVGAPQLQMPPAARMASHEQAPVSRAQPATPHYQAPPAPRPQAPPRSYHEAHRIAQAPAPRPEPISAPHREPPPALHHEAPPAPHREAPPAPHHEAPPAPHRAAPPAQPAQPGPAPHHEPAQAAPPPPPHNEAPPPPPHNAAPPAAHPQAAPAPPQPAPPPQAKGGPHEGGQGRAHEHGH